MAQEIAKRVKFPEYKEGPFVLVEDGFWRVEVELVGNHSSVLPHSSIYEFLVRNGHHVRSTEKATIVRSCDLLNIMVRRKQIKLVGRDWILEGALQVA